MLSSQNREFYMFFCANNCCIYNANGFRGFFFFAKKFENMPSFITNYLVLKFGDGNGPNLCRVKSRC